MKRGRTSITLGLSAVRDVIHLLHPLANGAAPQATPEYAKRVAARVIRLLERKIDAHKHARGKEVKRMLVYSLGTPLAFASGFDMARPGLNSSTRGRVKRHTRSQTRRLGILET